MLVDMLVVAGFAADTEEDDAGEAVVGEPAVDILDEVGKHLRVAGLLEDERAGFVVIVEEFLGGRLQSLAALAVVIAFLFFLVDQPQGQILLLCKGGELVRGRARDKRTDPVRDLRR